MFLTDNHIHSTFSYDATASMFDMALASAEKGISEVCFTDHVEDCALFDALSFHVTEFGKWDELYKEHEKVREMLKDKIDVRLGAEFSSINHRPEKAKELYTSKKLDFVIGSVHNLKELDDFYSLEYHSAEQCLALTERYIDEYIEVANIGFCDVLGHIGYHQKYAARQGVWFDIMEREEKLRELFEVIVSKGIGIEVNTSGLRDTLSASIPGLDVIRLYRECGGEIITTGTDSHHIKDTAAGIADVYELLKEAGFEYVTIFKEHKPEFIKI